MKLIEEVQIPLLVLPPPETCRLVEWHVRDGEHVMMGQVIFDLEVGDEVWAVESFFTGFIKIEALAGSVRSVGDSIALMVCDPERDGYATVGVELSHARLAQLDTIRGKVPRREFLWRLVCEAIEQRAGADKPCEGTGGSGAG